MSTAESVIQEAAITDTSPMQLPQSSAQTKEFYNQLIRAKGINLIFGVTGQMKTMFGVNLVVQAFESGGCAGMVTFEPDRYGYRSRLGCALTGISALDLKYMVPGRQAEFLKLAGAPQYENGVLRLGLNQVRPDWDRDAEWVAERICKLAADLPGGLFLVDGLEAGALHGLNAAEYALVLERLSKSAPPGMSIWLTAQANSEAFGREILTLNHIDQTVRGKADIAGTIVGVGFRTADNSLKTISIAKHNGYWSGPKHVRLGLSACLRMEIPPVTLLPPHEATQYAAEVETKLRLPDAAPVPVAVKVAPAPVTAQPAVSSISLTEDDDDESLRNAGRIPPVPPDACEGFVGIERDIMRTEWWETATWSDRGMWLYLALRAAWGVYTCKAPRTQISVTAKPGEYITSIRQLAKQTNQSEKSIRGFLARARRGGVIQVFSIVSKSGKRCEVTDGDDQSTTPPTVYASVISVKHLRRDLSGEQADAKKA